MAQQSDDDVHVTPSRELSCVGLEFGEGTIDQEIPSQCWMRVCVMPAPESRNPTAQHCDFDAHATLTTELSKLVLVFGDETSVQEFPSQYSIEVCATFVGVVYWPTAQQSMAELQVMVLSELCGAEPMSLKFGVMAIIHDPPFSCSISV